MRAQLAPVAIVQQLDPAEALRCPCPVCLRLDRRFPGEGYQLALIPITQAERWLFDAVDRKRRKPR